MKRVLIYVFIAVIIIGIIGVIIYFLVHSGNQSENQTGQTGSLPSTNGETFSQNASGSLPNGGILNNGNSSAATRNFNIVSNEPAIDYFVDSRGGVTIIEPDGKIAAIANNNADTISPSKIQNIINAGFSYDGAKILVNFGDPKNPQTSVFDIKAKSWMPLPAGMVSPQWAPADYRIAYFRNNSDGTEALETLDASKVKNNIVAIMTLHIQDVSLLWLSKNKILFYDNPSIYTYGSVWFFDLQKKSVTPVITEQRGMEAVWSNTTTTMGIMFVGNTSQYGGRLQLVNGSGSKTEQLGFLTLPPKCLFNPFSVLETSGATRTAITTIASSTASSSYLALYCGVPRDQNAFSSNKLPDDYEKMALFTSDNIYRIDTSNGSVVALFDDQNQNMDVSHVKIFNDSLFFVNRYDQKLYSLSLNHQ
jgi:hypothetical protein